MKMIKAGLICAALLAVSACGNQGTIKVSKLAAAGSFDASKLPSAAIVRVPVDANGKQIADKAEIRVLDANASVEVKDGTAAARLFDGAVAPKNVRENVIVDELDRDTATESCWGWRRYMYNCAYGCGVVYSPTYYVGPVAYTYAAPVYYYTPVVVQPIYATTVVGYSYYYYPRTAGVVTYIY